jgi:hypothetical protein
MSVASAFFGLDHDFAVSFGAFGLIMAILSPKQ